MIEERVSKRAGAYNRATRTVAALQRAEALGCPRQPGQRVRYVVVDDDDRSHERVRLAHELETSCRYNRGFYTEQLTRAAESVLAPFGWRHREIDRYLSDRTNANLFAFE